MSTFLALLGSGAVVLGAITAVLGLFNQRRTKATAGQVQQITVQVDGQLSTLLANYVQLLERQSQLLGAMHQAGTPVPAKPAGPPPP